MFRGWGVRVWGGVKVWAGFRGLGLGFVKGGGGASLGIWGLGFRAFRVFGGFWVYGCRCNMILEARSDPVKPPQS